MQLKWKKGEFTILLKDGSKKYEDGYHVENFGIHKKKFKMEGLLWILTHLPTGTVLITLKTKKNAQDCAQYLTNNVNVAWTSTDLNYNPEVKTLIMTGIMEFKKEYIWSN